MRHLSLPRIAVVPLCVALLAVVAAAAASKGAEVPAGRLVPPTGHGTAAGLDSALTDVALASRRGATAGLTTARRQLLEVSGRRVRVTITARPGRAKAVRALVRRAGGKVNGEADGMLDALVWPGSLRRLGDAPAIATLSTPARPLLEEASSTKAAAAAAVDEGVAITNAGAWQAAGYDGSGVKVAIVDGGFYGYADLLGTGLPASVTAIDHCSGDIVAPPAQGGTEHGTAVAEIVHKMAPGAQLYLICVDSLVGLGQAVQDAVDAGVRIVNHSVGWFNTSRGDGSGGPGTPDALVAYARAHGILWVNAAGDATQHWSGTFTPNASIPQLNDFAAGDALDTITLPAGGYICAALKWDAWPTTTQDFDLYLYDSITGQPVDASGNDQAGHNLKPTEELCYQNTSGSSHPYGIAIAKYQVTTSPRLDMWVFGDASPQYQVAAGSLIEPATSPQTLAVGVNCFRSNHFGSTTEFFSPRGPTIDGRVKPDLIAPDATSSSVYGANAGNCTSGFNGTSAATPHVAGAAALLLQRRPALTPGGLEGALDQLAISHRFSSSADNTVGNGNLWLGGVDPSGTVAFSFANGNRTDVFTANEDGTGFRDVASHQSSLGTFLNPSWAPDGSKLAFTSSTVSPYGVSTVAPDGSSFADAITSTSGSSYFNAAFTAGGTQISFDDNGTIMLLNPSTHVALPFVVGRDASWSPDGTKVAYLGNGTTQLLVANADGTNSHVLATGISSYANEAPAWSPDSATLAFTAAPAQVWLVGANGASPRALVPGKSPQWSADGTRLLYLTPGGASLNSIDANGSNTKVVSAEWPADPPGGIAWRPQPRTTAPAALNPPTVTGEKIVGQSLHTDVGRWVSSPGAAVTYGWQRCSQAGTGCVQIAGASDSVYRLAGSDANLTVRSVVTLTDANGSQSATSSPTTVIFSVTGLPSAPTSVTAVAGLNQATISFTPSFSSDVVSYTVYASAGGPSATGAASPITVTGLTHQSYTFTVTATNKTGEGLPSSPSNAVTPIGAPNAPTAVVATAGDGQATVTFSPPADDGGTAITSYTATASPGGQASNSSGGPITVNGLTNGQSYTFTVRATNAGGTSAASSPSGSVTPLGPARGATTPPAAAPRADVPPFVAPPSRPPPLH